MGRGCEQIVFRRVRWSITHRAAAVTAVCGSTCTLMKGGCLFCSEKSARLRNLFVTWLFNVSRNRALVCSKTTGHHATPAGDDLFVLVRLTPKMVKRGCTVKVPTLDKGKVGHPVCVP